jgi:ectoine hydroxylase-related dioxygenase (phytanoyl-CoA dioxygenase family)
MKYNVNKLSKKFYENGWVKIKNFVTKKDINNLKFNCFKYLQKNFKKYKGKNINFSGNFEKFEDINSFHKASDIPVVRKIAKEKKFNNLIKNFLENEIPKYMDSEIFAKPALNGLSSPVHQDNYYWAIEGGNAITAWLALDGASKKNGGVFYYNKSHKIDILDHKPSYAKGSSQTIKNPKKLKKFKKVYPKLEKGDILIHHSQIVHGSGENNSKWPRTGLTFQFKTIKSRTNKIQLNLYLKQLKMQIKNRSKFA